MRKTSLSVVACALLLCAGTAHAKPKAPMNITQCGQTIDVPGNYIVSQSLDCSGPGVIIAADHIHLIVSGSVMATGGTAISGSGSHVLITGGGVVAGEPDGVDLSGDHIAVDGLSIAGQAVQGAVSLELDGSNESVIRCTITGGIHGILVGA